jgi:hypothetical protein
MAVGPLLAFLTGDPRFVLAKESALSGLLGILLLGILPGRDPAWPDAPHVRPDAPPEHR